MKMVKMSGLAALLALVGVVAVVVAGIGSASAEEENGDPEIVLCHESVALCPAGMPWPGGKTVTTTNIETAVKFLGTPTAECKESKLVGEVVEEMAAQLTYKINTRELKKCNREGCNELNAKYENMASGKLSVAAGDKYSLKFTTPIITLECEKKPCVYITESETASLPIDNPTSTGTPVALAKEIPMKLIEGGAPCLKTIKWDATYQLTGGALTVLLSLFKL